MRIRDLVQGRVEGLVRRAAQDRMQAAASKLASVSMPKGRRDQDMAQPLAAALRGLEENVDPTVPLQKPCQGLGPAAVVDGLAENALRVLAPEVLGRQRAFNAQLRDACQLLGGELVRLRAEVEALKQHVKDSGAPPGSTGSP